MIPLRVMVMNLFYGKQQPTQSPRFETGTSKGFYVLPFLTFKNLVSFLVTMCPGSPLGLQLPGTVTVVFTTKQVRKAGLEVLSKAAKTMTVS